MERLKRILIVDDERFNINVLVDILKDEYHCLVSKNGENALKIATGNQQPDLIFLDVMMPGMDGYAVCKELKSDPKTRQIPVIFITAQDTPEEQVKGLNLGAEDYIIKPVQRETLLLRIRIALARRDREIVLHSVLNQQIEQRILDGSRTNIGILISLMEAARQKDNETANHTVRMAMICYLIALEMQYSKEEAYTIFLAAPLHDIGKLGVRDEVLLYPGNLRIEKPEWWPIMQGHTTNGAKILGKCKSDSNLLEAAYAIAYYHHEKVDGSGYPMGLKGSDIPEVAMIGAAADMIDAMLDPNRSYRDKAMSEEAVQTILKKDSGTKLPEAVVTATLSIWEQIVKVEQIFIDGEDFPFETFASLGPEKFFNSTEKLIKGLWRN